MCNTASKCILFLLIFASNSYEIDTDPQSKILPNETKDKLTVYQEEDDDRSSLVFVFDTTGSMHNDLKQLREGAEMILNTALEESDVIADFVFVPFHDPAVGPATVTKDKDVFKSALNIIRVYGGGDCPEKSLSGIQLALNVSRPRSQVYVFTDATASDHRLVGRVLNAVQRKQSQVVFVLTGHCNDLDRPSYKVYQQIAAASSGQVFNLNKTNVHKVLDFVRSSLKGRTVNLESSVNPPGYNHSQGIPVDSTLNEVTVSISGSKPQIKVVNPRGQEVSGPPQLITTLDLAEIVIVKVLQPEPGNWTITTGSEDSYSLKVVGTSNLTFNHGFSVSKPGSMAETSHRPLQGAYNHLMIALTQTDRPVQMNYAEIQSLDGKTLFEIALKEIDKNKQIYLTEPFLPPDDFFYVAINGRDEYNQDLRRIGATAIQAKTPDVPYLTVPQKIEARIHERVVLKCKVESLVPVTVYWAKEGERSLQDKVSSLQSTAVNYIIEDLKEEYAGKYRCVAKNVAGVTQSYTAVVMLVDPPELIIEPVNKTVQIGGTFDIICTAKSDSVLLEFDIYFNGVKIEKEYEISIDEESYIASKRQTFNNVTVKNSGIYTCIAENKGGGKSSISTKITIQSNPIAQIIGPHTITKPIHSTIQLVCRIENADHVVWTSPNKSVVRKLRVNGTVIDMYDVENVSEDGVWSCMAVRGERMATDSVEITVLIKPEVLIEGNKNISVLNGSTYNIACLIRAKPEPRILWHRETERFLNNTITLESPNLYKSQLVLNSSKESVNGTYFCIGENSEGIGQDNVVVTVRRPMTLVQGFTDTQVNLYSQLELQCKVDAFPTPQIQWYHNNTHLAITENLRLSQDNSTIFILKVEFQKLGLYSCEADNGFEKLRVDGSLIANDLERPVLLKDVQLITTQKGNSTKITCRVIKGKPEPTVTWKYKSSTSDAFTTLPSNVIWNGNKELNILNVETNNSGIYRCTAENALGQDFHDITLKVLYPPEFVRSKKEKDDKPLEVKEGERVTFSCHSIGFPPPITVWTKNYQPIAYSKNVYLTDENELIISQANEYDAGLYTCNVTSVLATLQRNFTLVVYAPPTITPPDFEPALDVLEGQLVELPCTAHGHPKPEVIWLQNGDLVTENRKYIDEFGLRFVANLTDFGEYTCIARSKYGSSSVNYTIFIWVAPYIEPPLKTNINALLGANVTLNCDATGFPVPTVVWEFQEHILTENTTDMRYNDVGNIFITNASSKHDGLYTCIVENFVGIAKKEIILNINEPPKILSDNFSGYYVGTDKDTALAISCRTAGKPKPFVAWVKDDLHYLDKDTRYDVDIDGTLTIKAPSEELSGLYTCVAKNTVGSANRTVTVKIYPLLQRMQADESQSTIQVLEGSNTSIKCPSQASDDDTVKWYKDAKLIFEGYLEIQNITRKNTSTYACVVSNEIGSSYSNVRLNVEWPPTFIDDEGMEKSFEVVKGADWYFDCGVDAEPKAQTQWLFNSKPLVSEDKERLKLMNIELYHTGIYKCIVSNIHGTVARQFVLDVLEPPFISYFDFLDVQLNAGSNATLQCDAKGSPTPEVKWTFNNTNWHLVNSTLTSTNLTLSSEGLFTCTATNKAGRARLVYRIDVVVKARVEDIVLYRGGGGENVEGGVQVVTGTRVRLSCVASGNPLPKIQWIKNGNTLAQNSKNISYADIILDHVNAEHTGVYSCVAVNEGGPDERNIKLDVLEPPKILQNLFLNSNDSTNVTYMEVISGQTFYLHCHPYGNPAPAVYWFRDSQLLRFFDETMVSSDYGEVVKVETAEIGHSANYTCVAKNSIGEASLVYLVDVLVPPSTPKETTKIFTTRVSRPLNLTCPVQGVPLPIVTWIKHPYTELGGGKVQLFNDNYTLFINNTEVKDSGIYSCIMTNKVGSSEIKFNVTVEQPPYISGKLEERYMVLLGRSVVLKCQAGGVPTPKVVWLKDNQNLAENIHPIPDGSAVVIWNVSSRHAGQYVCVAMNDAGTARARYDVIVQVPGKWSSWSEWTLCNVTCGLGYQIRSRNCRFFDNYNVTYDRPSDYLILDKSSCKGAPNEKKKCHMPSCEEEEFQRWSPWSKWSKCSTSCGVGTQMRSRRCRSNTPCVGDNVQLRKCPNLPHCDEDQTSNNEVFNEGSPNNISPLIPQDVFETQPDIGPGHPSGVEEVYIKSDTKVPSAVYDVKVSANLDGSDRGPCNPGFKFNSTTLQCEDIDECVVDRNQCHASQLCVNAAGAYSCACAPGFASLGAGQRCLDINECALGTHGCAHACVNVAGGYVCACAPHMRLARDRHTCVLPSSSYGPYEDLEKSEEYLSTSVEHPFPSLAKYKNLGR